MQTNKYYSASSHTHRDKTKRYC